MYTTKGVFNREWRRRPAPWERPAPAVGAAPGVFKTDPLGVPPVRLLVRMRQRPVLIVGGGPSALSVDLQGLSKHGVVVAVNDAAVHLPKADIAFTADFTWLRRRAALVRGFAGELVVAAPPRIPPGNWWGGRAVMVVGRHGNHNSGLEALWWAADYGARRIVLVGFDLNTVSHWFPEYAWKNRMSTPTHYAAWVREFAVLAKELEGKGVEVWNANSKSAIRSFPYVSLSTEGGEVQYAAGIALPASDTHMAQWLRGSAKHNGHGTYQLNKIQAVLMHLKKEQHRRFVDVGAHVGTWSKVLAPEFEHVLAFEPVPLHARCFRYNTLRDINVRLVEAALGEVSGLVALRTTASNTGESWISGRGAVPMWTLDDEAHGLDDIDLLKIDCEGFEYFVVRGGMETIKRNHPVIIVEQDERYAVRHGVKPRAAVEQLEALGYKVSRRMTSDYIMVPT